MSIHWILVVFQKGLHNTNETRTRKDRGVLVITPG
ncbi:predicted protein [Plenodomus lingam JN3]|uniref:Predicted protein n=1 Tax=Leptosphaeria maculans (strain JN3 / isolate v23.1.3 / race Av1-4-5-6-7-8) TaxID=985895 RepID=E4ZW94_LEPMJ|nr:predicted protein [Plenodomus lingam JN3]CBX95870.1 predicted protein [Plenodomus lingam JN3]